MVSGIVYFDEIIENIKDATGIDNMRPLYSRIRRWVYNCEMDIGAGGVIVLKKKEFNIGDGFYDGVTLRLPEDFYHEWTYGSMQNGIVQGNVFRLFDKGPDQIDFKYLGFLLDEEGNPYTTRNRLPAIVSYSIYRLYSSKYFTGTGNHNQYQIYKMEYEDNVQMARGLDAFPSEEEWNEIGAIRLGGTFEAMTDCGMKQFCLGTEDPSTIDTTQPQPDPTCIANLEGVINGFATVSGEMVYRSLVRMNGISYGVAAVVGTLQKATFPDFAIEGEINGVATVSGQLNGSSPVVLCSDSFSHSGNSGTFQFTLDVGSGIGFAGVRAQPFSVPDRFRIVYNGVEVANSKFIGAQTYEQQLLDLGYDPSELDLTVGAPGWVEVKWYKATASPTQATVFVDAPLAGTAWNIEGICPINTVLGSSTVNGTLNGIAQMSGTSFGGSTL